jgi:hypothetical protein
MTRRPRPDVGLLVLIIMVALAITYGVMKLADKVFLDKPIPEPEGRGYKRPPWIHNADPDAKVDLRYNPLAIEDDIWVPIRKTASSEDVEKLEELSASMRPPSLCVVCGDPMKREGVVETCDCPLRGYEPRS